MIENSTDADKPDDQGEPDQDGDDGVAALILLVVDGGLLGAFGLAFTPLYWGGVPVPAGALLSIILLPWLVRRAGEIDPGPSMAGAPLWAWLIVVMVLGLGGPGGDTLLPLTWQSLLLVGGGLGAGLFALRGVLEASRDG
jgi:hypothetical protein